MPKIGIMGNKDVIRAFGLVGMSVFEVENGNEARERIEKIKKEEEIKILFIMESIAEKMKEYLSGYEDSENLTIVPLPDRKDGLSLVDYNLRRLSKEAIGMEI